MQVTLFQRTNHSPSVSVHGDVVKVDFGNFLLEVDKDGLKDMLSSITTQLARLQIYVPGIK